VDALFNNIGKLQQPPRHPKWKDTVISVNVAGLERFKPAQDWLDKAQAAAPPSSSAATGEEFRRFLQQKEGRDPSSQEAAKVYNDFLKWQAGQR
jgi:hypothetical protein